jgi:hypothetical protein
MGVIFTISIKWFHDAVKDLPPPYKKTPAFEVISERGHQMET